MLLLGENQCGSDENSNVGAAPASNFTERVSSWCAISTTKVGTTGSTYRLLTGYLATASATLLVPVNQSTTASKSFWIVMFFCEKNSNTPYSAFRTAQQTSAMFWPMLQLYETWMVIWSEIFIASWSSTGSTILLGWDAISSISATVA